jgi:acyl-CoA synthetase (AMP-forming)/AMP-acid ligase II
VIDEGFPNELLSYVSLDDQTTVLRASDGKVSAGEIQIPTLELPPEALAFIQHSAGTTGLQKGVSLTHGAVLRQPNTWRRR